MGAMLLPPTRPYYEWYYDPMEEWLLPDGTPWEMRIVSNPNSHSPVYRNSFAAAQEWRRFGIEVKVETTEMANNLVQKGDFDASGTWPAAAPFGAHPDLFRVFRAWHSDNYRPIGENAVWTNGGSSRWTDPQIDKIVNELRQTAWSNTEKLRELGIEGLKILTEEMPGIPTFAYPSFVGWDNYYWKNYPGAENNYTQPHYHWPNFKLMLPYLESTGRE